MPFSPLCGFLSTQLQAPGSHASELNVFGMHKSKPTRHVVVHLDFWRPNFWSVARRKGDREQEGGFYTHRRRLPHPSNSLMSLLAMVKASSLCYRHGCPVSLF